jgi:hypothetical protein
MIHYEKYDQPVHKQIYKFIVRARITNSVACHVFRPRIVAMFDVNMAQPADTTPPPALGVCVLTYHFQTHTTIYSFIYLSIY